MKTEIEKQKDYIRKLTLETIDMDYYQVEDRKRLLKAEQKLLEFMIKHED